MSCPDETQLAAFVERTSSAADRETVERHVYECDRCREALAVVVAVGGSPREIGRYRLDRPIGSGGMGVVWEAWDPALERRLAIKLLQPELTDDAGRARLLREARALATLQHPNVIAVHDVGEASGEVFIATELIDGEPMTTWQVGRAPAAVIAAYAQAATGLAAAHRAGLVHRDVKPSNILIGKDGRVRIGDFGLATRERTEPGGAVAGDAKLTRDGQIVGTPAYMAPEQREGKLVDERSDQYSLCVALAEALIGDRPEAGVSATALAASGVAAPWPAIARGLARDPAERHPDLGTLVAALEGRPARGRGWFVIGGVVVAAIAVASVVLVAGHGRASCAGRAPLADVWSDAARRSLAGGFHATNLAYADDAARVTIAALDRYATTFTSVDERVCETDEAPEIRARRVACLARLRGQVVQLAATLSRPDALVVQRAPVTARELSDPEICTSPGALADRTVPTDLATAMRMHLMSVRLDEAYTLRHLGKLRDARRIAERVLAEATAASLLPSIAEARHELGTILHAQDDPAAEPMLVAGLAAAAEAHADLRAAQISALLVEVVGAKGDVAAAERQAGLARPAILRAGSDAFLEAVVERGLGYANQEASKYAAAYAHYQRAETLHRSLGANDDVTFDRRAQVTALGSLDRIAEAARINDEVLASDRANLGPKHPRTIGDLVASGELAFNAGHYPEAAAALATAVSLDEEVSGRDSVHVASLRGKLGAVYLQSGRVVEAEAVFRETIRVLAAHKPAGDVELRGTRMNLAAVQILLGKDADAIVELDGLVAAARAAKDDESLGLVLENLGEALIGAGKYDRAIAVCHEALERDAKVFGPRSRRGAEANTTLGTAYAKAGQRAPAIAAYQLAIATFDGIEKDTVELGEPLTGLASLHDPAEARPLLERAVKVRLGGDPVDLAASRFALGRTRYALHEPDAHLDVEAAVALWEKAGERANVRRAEASAWLAAHR